MYEIDEIKDVRKAASIKADGIGLRHTIRIGSTTTFLWYDEKIWFVERK